MSRSHPERVTVTPEDWQAARSLYGSADWSVERISIRLARHAQQAREAETERCVQVALKAAGTRMGGPNDPSTKAREIAAAIRALPEQGNARHE